MELMTAISEITPQRAREIAQAYAEANWGDLKGTPYVSRYLHEDDDGYLVEIGAREWIEDGNRDYLLINGVGFVVDKQTGELVQTPMMLLFGRLDDMREIVVE